MGDYRTEPFDPSPRDPDSDEDYEYGTFGADRGAGGPNVLWGRVGVFAAALLLAFLFGRACAPSEGVSEKRFQALTGQLEDARDDIDRLEGENAELKAAAKPAKSPKATPTATPGAEEGDELAGETYIVKAGDTLRGIAQTFYGDASKAEFLAEYNEIEDPSSLRSGQEIIIPDEPQE